MHVHKRNRSHIDSEHLLCILYISRDLFDFCCLRSPSLQWVTGEVTLCAKISLPPCKHYTFITMLFMSCSPLTNLKVIFHFNHVALCALHSLSTTRTSSSTLCTSAACTNYTSPGDNMGEEISLLWCHFPHDCLGSRGKETYTHSRCCCCCERNADPTHLGKFSVNNNFFPVHY